MLIRILKNLIFSTFIMAFSAVYACTHQQTEKISIALTNLEAELSSTVFNRVYLGYKSAELDTYEQNYQTCIEQNLLNIQNLYHLEKNIILFDKNDKLIDIYDKKIASIKANNYQIKNELLKIQTISALIDNQLKLNVLNDQKEKKQKNVMQIWHDYKSNPNSAKLFFIPFHDVFSSFTKLIESNQMLFYFVLLIAFVSLFLGIYLFNNILQRQFIYTNNTLFLYIKYLKIVLPVYLFIVAIKIFYHYKTQHWMEPPVDLLIINHGFNLMSLYLLLLTSIFFYTGDNFNKNAMISLLIHSIGLMFILNSIKIFFIFVEKTNFILLLNLLIYVPFFFGVVVNYLACRWAYVQKDLPLSPNVSIILRAFFLSFVFIYSILCIIFNELGYYNHLTLTQFILGFFICFFYYKFLHIQYKPHQYLSQEKRLAIRKWLRIFFGEDYKHKMEKNILIFSANGFLFVTFIYLLCNIFEVSNETFNMLHDTIFTAIKIGGLSISIYNLIIAMIVFSSIAMIEVAISSYFLFKKKKNQILYIYKTKINFINLMFRLIALIIALLFLDISFTHFMILFGSLSLGVGFGLKFIIEDFFAGLCIVIRRDFLVGDDIKILNIYKGDTLFEGKIKHIYSLNTKLIDIDHRELILPNSVLFKNGVIKSKSSSKPQSSINRPYYF